MLSDKLAWLRWVLVPQLGLKRSQTLLSLVDSPQALFLHPERWPLPAGVKQTIKEMNLLGEQHPIHRRALEQLRWADNQPQHHLIFPGDSAYPTQLEAIDNAPLVLWGKGSLDALTTTQIGVVGSRHASANAIRHAKSISQDLANAGLTITSGGAKGIDAASHQAAVEASASTIAVLGCGVDVIYPKVNRRLFQQIEERGLLLSEYPLGTQPKPGHFPRRNRLISALSDIIIVVEAALKSGSLITAQHALEQGKDIFAMPGDIGNPNSEGCHRLIQDGAYLLSDAKQLLQHLNWSDSTFTESHAEHPGLTALQSRILHCLQCGQRPLESLAFELNTSVHSLLEPLLEMELNGVIEQLPGGYALA